MIHLFSFLKVQSVKLHFVCFIQLCRIAIAINRAHSFMQFCLNFLSHSVIKLHHQANDHTNRQSFLNFCEILRNFVDKSKFRGKGQIPQLGSKFHAARKTVGPRLVDLL